MADKLQVPDYVTKNMQKIAGTGMGDLDLREIGRLLIDWADKYGDDDYIKTVEWLSENDRHFEQVKQLFFNKSDGGAK